VERYDREKPFVTIVSMKKKPLVSVIIPTRNSETPLKECLDDLKKQTYKNLEIIIIDNNSTDKTKEVAKKYTKFVFNKGPERSAQINFGVRKAKGKYVYYTGSDLARDRNLVEEGVAKLEDEDYDAVYLNVLTRLRTKSVWERARALERRLYFKQPGVSAARFYKRDLFIKLNGLDESFGGVSDDLEFQHRIDLAGYKTAFINAKEYNLREYTSLGIIIKRSLYYGWLINGYMKKHPAKTKKQYRLVRQEFVENRKILLKDKYIFVFFVIYKLAQYFFGGIGLVLCRISHKDKRIEGLLHQVNYS
jgi:glycosyltransferase involved in cell wall biosynthesis